MVRAVPALLPLPVLLIACTEPATSITDPFGSSAISISNADGTSTFTVTNQLYCQYDQVLAEGDQTAPKMWIFTVDSNVQAFSFVVYVSASVSDPVWFIQLQRAECILLRHPLLMDWIQEIIHYV